MLRAMDFSLPVYGGAVTWTEWWDNKRIEDGRIAKNELWKKASFYTYLGIGVPATLMSAFGWWRRWEPWTERISHGFMYDFPRFIYNVVQSMGAGGRSQSEAVREAQRIIRERQKTQKQLPTGRYPSPAFQKEFEGVRLVG